MDIEVCAYSLESCMAARRAGATRVELCASPFEGGTTPSAASITGASAILKNEDAIPPLQLYVMIRPRGGDFLYNQLEFAQMEQEIEFIKGLNTASLLVDGVVFGLLHPDGSIDTHRTKQLVARAKNGIYTNPVTGEQTSTVRLGVTFHRAFDMSMGAGEVYPRATLEDVIATGADRILTSGFHPTAMEGRGVIGELIKQSAGRIEIMAGSGVGVINAAELAVMQVDALHLSGKAERESAMHYRNPLLSMGGAKGVPEYSILYTDEATVKAVNRIASFVEVKK